MENFFVQWMYVLLAKLEKLIPNLQLIFEVLKRKKTAKNTKHECIFFF